MMSGLYLLGGGEKFLQALVHADVNDLEACALGHHADEVLADVMQIAADGAHEQTRPVDTGIFRRQQRFQHGMAAFMARAAMSTSGT